MRQIQSLRVLFIAVLTVIVTTGCSKNQDEQVDGVMVNLIQSDFLDLEDSSDLYAVEDVTESVSATNYYADLEETLNNVTAQTYDEDSTETSSNLTVEEMPAFLKDENWTRVYPDDEDDDEDDSDSEETSKSVADTTTPKTTTPTSSETAKSTVTTDKAITATVEAETKEETVSLESDSEVYFKIGTDKTSQSVSPRDWIKMTMVVMTDDASAETVDFQIYAVPDGNSLYRSGYYMLGYGYNIDVVNGQAQYTKYWNGQNVYDNFLPEGDYSIYVYYKVRDDDDALLADDGRYWGYSTDYYLDLN